jgi:putative FmdB family regulatory protein
MPLYEYRCEDCTHKFEALISTEAEELRLACPNCHSMFLQKLMSASNFLKGANEPKNSKPTETPETTTLSINGREIMAELVPATLHHPDGDIPAMAICPKILMKKSKKNEDLN